MILPKYTLLTIVFLACSVSMFAATTQVTTNSKDSVFNDFSFNYDLQTSLGDSIVNYGKLFLNAPYRSGASGDSSFDCSGFTSFVYKNFGYNLQRSSSQQATQFPSVDRTQLHPGDLVFFNGRRRNGRVGHVGIVVAATEDGEFDFIHASTSEGVVISNSKADYYKKRFVKAGRVLNLDSLKALSSSTAVASRERTNVVAPKPVSQPERKVVPAKYHYVRSGETLSAIANKYGLSIAQLKKNNLLKKDAIHPKQRLLIKPEEVIMTENNTALADNSSTAKSNNLTETKHRVRKGESLYSIAQKYNIPVTQLIEMNQLENGKIFPGQELKLADEAVAANNTVEPKNTTAPQTAQEVTHKVRPGESLNLIAKKYNTTVAELTRINHLKDGRINAGQNLKVVEGTDMAILTEQKKTEEAPVVETAKKAVAENYATHQVEKGETLSSIARKYNMTLAEIRQANHMNSNVIKSNQVLNVKPLAETSDTKQLAQNNVQPAASPKTISSHKIVAGESLFSLARQYNVSVADIKALNHLNSDAIQVGQEIKIPAGQDMVLASAKSTNSSSDNKSTSAAIHKVTSGETLSSIATKYGCSISDLQAWNGISGARISAGQELKVYTH